MWNLFAQDEIQIDQHVKLTLGLKAEHNVYSGTELLPNARLAWEVAPNHLLWAAASRTPPAPSPIANDLLRPPTPPFPAVAAMSVPSLSSSASTLLLAVDALVRPEDFPGASTKSVEISDATAYIPT